MAYDNNIAQLIEAYLKGELSGNELADFESNMATDKNLAMEVKKARSIQNLVIQNRLLNVKALAEQEQAKFKDKTNHTQKWLLGSVISAVIITGALFLYSQDKVDNEAPTKQPTPQKVTTEKTTTEAEPLPPKPILTHPSTEQVSPSEVTPATKQLAMKPEEKELVIIDTAAEDELKEARPSDSIKVVLTPKPQEKTVETMIDKCATTHLEADIVTSPSCKKEQTGEISISKISGGQAPYLKTIHNGSGDLVTQYHDLQAGNYIVVLIDANKCKKEFSVEVQQKNCPINMAINPTYGERWIIPTESASGKISIHSRTGMIVFSTSFERDEALNWNGRSENGEINVGYYTFEIQYTDGTYQKGSITVTQ